MRYVTSVPHLERPFAMNAGSIALLDENGDALLADGSVDGERESDGAARDDRRDAGVDLEYAGRARCGGRENDIGGGPPPPHDPTSPPWWWTMTPAATPSTPG